MVYLISPLMLYKAVFLVSEKNEHYLINFYGKATRDQKMDQI